MGLMHRQPVNGVMQPWLTGAHTGCVQAMLEGYERQRHDIQSSFEGARDDMAAVRPCLDHCRKLQI